MWTIAGLSFAGYWEQISMTSDSTYNNFYSRKWVWNAIYKMVAILFRPPWANWGFSVIFRNVRYAWVGYYDYSWTDGSEYEIEVGIVSGNSVRLYFKGSQISVDMTGCSAFCLRQQHRNSILLAFVRGFHRSSVVPSHKRPIMQKAFRFPI